LRRAGDLDDDDDAVAVLVLLFVDDVLDLDDLDDGRPVFVELRLQMVDRVVGVVQGPRPMRGELPMSDAVENVVGRRVRSRGRSLRRHDDDLDDDLDDLDDAVCRLLLPYAVRRELYNNARYLRELASSWVVAGLRVDLRNSRRPLHNDDHNHNDNDNDLDHNDDAPVWHMQLGGRVRGRHCHGRQLHRNVRMYANAKRPREHGRAVSARGARVVVSLRVNDDHNHNDNDNDLDLDDDVFARGLDVLVELRRGRMGSMFVGRSTRGLLLYGPGVVYDASRLPRRRGVAMGQGRRPLHGNLCRFRLRPFARRYLSNDDHNDDDHNNDNLDDDDDDDDDDNNNLDDDDDDDDDDNNNLDDDDDLRTSPSPSPSPVIHERLRTRVSSSGVAFLFDFRYTTTAVGERSSTAVCVSSLEQGTLECLGLVCALAWQRFATITAPTSRFKR